MRCRCIVVSQFFQVWSLFYSPPWRKALSTTKQCYGLALRFPPSPPQPHSFVHDPPPLQAPQRALKSATGGEGLDPNDPRTPCAPPTTPMSPIRRRRKRPTFRSVTRASNGSRWHRRRSPQTASGSHISGVSADTPSDGADAASLQRFARHRHGT